MNEKIMVNDFNRIQKNLPNPIIEWVLKQTDTKAGNYVPAKIKENRSGWLWRGFVRALLPFQLKRTIFGNRKTGIFNNMYWILLCLIIMVAYSWKPVCVAVSVILWGSIGLYALLPGITSCWYLWKNRSFYRRLGGV